jgi:Flp pilus assembly protein TadD
LLAKSDTMWTMRPLAAASGSTSSAANLRIDAWWAVSTIITEISPPAASGAMSARAAPEWVRSLYFPCRSGQDFRVSDDEQLERLAAGDSAGVIEELTRALEADPEDAVSWLRLGAVYLTIAHGVEAEQALARAVALDGDDVEARLCYADALARLEKHDAAAFQLVQARRIAPDDARVHRQLGIAFFDKQLFDKAAASLARAAELDPRDPRAPFVLGLIADARRDPAGAIAHYRRAVALDPDSVDARCTLADALATMGELHEAAHELEEAQRRDRTNVRIAQNLEVLRRGLRELESHRLLGKSEADFERSALVQKGQLKRKGTVPRGEAQAVRYGTELAEVWLEIDGATLTRLTLVLPDPPRAAAAPGTAFDVTVVGKNHASERADYATAATLTFLRETLGCPLTRAGEIYAALLRDQKPVAWAGARIAWTRVTLGERELVGLCVETAP